MSTHFPTSDSCLLPLVTQISLSWHKSQATRQEGLRSTSIQLGCDAPGPSAPLVSKAHCILGLRG